MACPQHYRGINLWPGISHRGYLFFAYCLLLIATVSRVDAVEIIHFVESKDYARVMGYATGLKMADDGTVYVTSAEKGTLLKIVDGEVEASRLTPKVFKDNDLGGIDVLPNGQLVVVNEDSGQVAVINSELGLIERFAQSGGDAGELNSPGPVAVSIIRKSTLVTSRTSASVCSISRGYSLHDWTGRSFR